MAEISIPLNCTVHTYPSDWFRSDGPRKRQLGFGDAVPQFDPGPFLGSSESAGPDSDVAKVASVESATCRRIVSSRPIQPLEALFVRPLPRWKRAIDIVGSLVELVVASPIMVATATAIMLTSKGPVFFVQERTGQGYRRFKMYKFRTMADGAEKQRAQVGHLNEMTGPLIKIDGDPRLTKIGSFMRKTSIDELPQLFNVLKGDMTIIGPRALSPLPSKYESWQLRRFVVKPGIACTWQAERRAERDFREWMRCDLRYLDNASFWVDVRVFFKTVLNVVGRNGSC
jgi:lipopolysaccharide/colanic/teichoic acid biosynthesis glycosyltransferase